MNNMNKLRNEKIDRIYYKLETIFKYLILLSTLLAFNSFFANSKAITLFSTCVAGLGAVLLSYRLINMEKYIRFYGFAFLIAFVFCYGVSSIVNFEYGIFGNIKTMIWSTFQFGILYALDYKGDTEKERKDYFGVLKLFFGYILLNNLISIAMLIIGYGEPKATSFSNNIIGYVWGRLWGAYYDPNNGSVFCVAVIVISIYWAIKSDKLWKRILLGINIFICLAYMAFSDSRTGMVCLATALLTMCFLLIRNSEKISLKNGMKTVLSLLLASVIAIAGVASVLTITKTYNAVVTKVQSSQPSAPSTEDNENNKSDTAVIGREDNQIEKDISNRRFSLWGSGIEIWKTTPLFGTTQRNLTAYALANLPDTYMVNNDKGGHFDTTHNMYIDVLVCQGIIGAIVFVAFLFMIVVLISRKMLFTKDYKQCNNENILLVTLVVTFAVSSIFVLDLIYINTAAAVLFWLSLGRLVKNLKLSDAGKAETDE